MNHYKKLKINDFFLFYSFKYEIAFKKIYKLHSIVKIIPVVLYVCEFSCSTTCNKLFSLMDINLTNLNII